MPTELANAPEVPDHLEYLWQYFQELSASRGSNGFGLNPISFLDIDAWQRVTGRQLDRWEVETIKALDLIFLSAFAKDSQE